MLKIVAMLSVLAGMAGCAWGRASTGRVPEHDARSPAPGTLRSNSECESRRERSAQAAHRCVATSRTYFPVPAEDARPVLSGFCEIAERPGVLGCRGCAPKFVAADAPPDAFAEVTSLIEGPFTGPGRVEVLVGFSPCGPESERAATRLLRHDGAGFRSVEGFSGLDDARCRASRNADGYARLACVAQDYLASEPVGADGIEIWLDVFDLHRRQVQRVVSVFDTLRSACEDGRLSELRAFGIGDFDFKDLDGDGDDDLWLMALSMMTAEPVRYDAECRQYLEPGEPTVGTPNPLQCALDKYRCDALAFLLEGGEWRPSAETQVLLAELRARKSTTSALP